MRGRETVRKLLEAGRLPEDALLDSARVTINGRSGVSVEGQHGVVELSDQRIRLKTGSGLLSITGTALQLAQLSAHRALVSGETIESVSFQ